MEKIPTAEEFVKQFRKTNPIAEAESIEHWMGQHCIEFAKLHVEAMMKDMEQKLLDTLDDNQYMEENVCGVIEEIREYKPDNIK
jgi:hypothetical protein